jgi:small subunit ribosomal protein S6
MSRLYEFMFILRPDLAEEDVDKLIGVFTTAATTGGAVIKSSEKMGRRKLAYQVRKFNEGNYVLVVLEADGALVKELERRLRVNDSVIKFITVRIDEEEKRLAKVRALRASHRKLSAEPQPAPVQQAAPAHAPVPPPAPVAAAPVAAPAAEAPAAAAAPAESAPVA